MASKKRVLRKVYSTTPAKVIKARQALVLSLHAQGRTIEQIADQLNMQVNHASRDLNAALQEMIRSYAHPTPEQNYVRYAAFQMGVVRKLQEAADTFMADPDNKQYGALVGALRAQSDIYDKVLDKGVEFGVIQERRAQDAIRLSPRDMRLELREEIATLEKLLDEVDSHAHKPGGARESTRAVRRIRRVRVGPSGVLKSIPDWKYRTMVYNPDGTERPQRDFEEGDTSKLSVERETLILEREVATHRREADQQETGTSQPAQQPAPEPKESWLVPPRRGK